MSTERAAQLVDAGIWLKLSGDVDGARRLFERALKLDPENPRAKELLSQGPTAAAAAYESSPSNPFERVSSSPSAAEMDWGAATGFEGNDSLTSPIAPAVSPAASSEPEENPPPYSIPSAVAPEDALLGWELDGPTAEITKPSIPAMPVASSPSALTDDWGTATGQIASPVPQVPPVQSMFAPRGPTPVPSSPSGERQTQKFAITSGQPFANVLSPQPGSTTRSTLPFASSTSAPSTTPASTPRQTMMFATQQPAGPAIAPPPTFIPPAPPVAPPNLLPKAAPQERPKRSTLTFSSQPETLAPSVLPEVSPVVIRLGADDASPDAATDELPSIVDSLRNQVNSRTTPQPQLGKFAQAPAAPNFPSPPNPPHSQLSLDAPDPLAPTSIVITDTRPEPSPPRATPPMFSETDAPIAQQADEAPFEIKQPQSGPDEDAWNWSASTAPLEPAFQGSAPSPRPSPVLSPEASSGWDQRSNPGIKLADMSAPNHPLEFVSSSSKISGKIDTRKGEVAVLVRGAKDLIELDDHTGAMELIAKALALAPDDADVRTLQERSERTLLAMFESKLGHLDKLPRVLLKDDEIIWLNLDHRAGFVLAQIDGAMTFEDLFAVSGMSRIDTARILAQLVDEGVISRGS